MKYAIVLCILFTPLLTFSKDNVKNSEAFVQQIFKVSTPIGINGELSEAAWNAVMPTSPFINK
jgi:hypothetical protein